VSLPLLAELGVFVVCCAVAFAGGVWWGKLHPTQATALLTDLDKAGQAVKKVT
jgi:hypothetical protein